MTAELRRSLVLAGVGLMAGFGLVLALFGGGELVKRQFTAGGSPAPVAAIPESPTGKPDAAGIKAGEEAARETTGKEAPGKPDLAGEQIPAPASPAANAAKTPIPPVPSSEDAKAPTFDIIRVEPNGETVIAGRGAPNTTVEMLRDGEPIARALIDPSGQFAIVPPALPSGNSEITLRITASDGQVRRSKESVAIVVSRNRDAKPLIAMSAPDKPTVVLSQPEPAAAAPVKEATAAPKPGAPAVPAERPKVQANPKPPGAAEGNRAAAPPVKVVSVDAEEGGRLYVTGQATPGATVRLYLNDTLVAPGSAGADGRLAFAIGKGVTPGEYRVRIDEVDPVSGKVKTRSEVAFAVPPLAAKAPSPVAALPARDRAARTVEPNPLSDMPAVAGEPAQAPPSVPSSREAGPATGTPGPDTATPSVSPLNEERQAAVTPIEPRPGNTPSARSAPAEAPASTVFIPEIGTAKIIRGDSLWQISRRIYGRGTRYTVIFDANQGQIRNPDLIYPGQIFVVPGEGKAAEKRG
ncbi:MAG: LysM peptidoglycan-binding domain-containing protein [Methylobacterium sp.]|uniref:LysM peptidoglycan-binding domain-containing protein n=1 Tax=Methylobacterium sp. TaxID=409 RepID=UPI0025E56B8A|nr:LysM peptidoglycan-binding domain-containing protein [Methylobacterium sp.]MBX9932187.1 LysM peptidoglycan-binding domain-containing protein [Methylobacterium sp.]